MNIISSNSSIIYGQTTTITVTGITSVSVTPTDSVINEEFINNQYIFTLQPLESTIYYISGYDSDYNLVIVNETIYVNVLVSSQNSNNNTNYNTPIILNAFGCNTYTWYPDTYLNQNTGSSVICTPLKNITYTITGTDIFNTISEATLEINVNTNLIFNPSEPTVYEGNLIKINVSLAGDNINYTWRSTLTNYLPVSCANLKYGQTLRLNPYQNLTYIVNAYSNNELITEGSVNIKIIPKPMYIIDYDILPLRLSNLIINRDTKELRKELIKDKKLSKSIIDFYYTTLQTAYRMEWTNKNGQTIKVNWVTIYQTVNETDSMLLGFEQQWKFFQYINNNQTRNGQTRSNFAFLLNNINQIYLEHPQKIYYIQQ
jgi:hypothetical protein